MKKAIAPLAMLIILFLPIHAGAFPVYFGASFRTKLIPVRGCTVSVTIGGHGPAVVLLHGISEDSRMWKPLALALHSRFTVIAPDLPGIGNSSIPVGKFSLLVAARQIHDAVVALGYHHVRLVGHDVGVLVAYAYAAEHPTEVDRLALMDLTIPGVPGWKDVFFFPGAWHFQFYGATPLALVKGRERIYFDHFWNDFAATNKTGAISESARQAYTLAYARPGRMRAALAYFAAIPQDAPEFARLAQTKSRMPVLAIGGDQGLGAALAAQVKLIATNVSVVILSDTGHWLIEEAPKQTIAALTNFLEH